MPTTDVVIENTPLFFSARVGRRKTDGAERWSMKMKKEAGSAIEQEFWKLAKATTIKAEKLISSPDFKRVSSGRIPFNRPMILQIISTALYAVGMFCSLGVENPAKRLIPAMGPFLNGGTRAITNFLKLYKSLSDYGKAIAMSPQLFTFRAMTMYPPDSREAISGAAELILVKWVDLCLTNNRLTDDDESIAITFVQALDDSMEQFSRVVASEFGPPEFRQIEPTKKKGFWASLFD